MASSNEVRKAFTDFFVARSHVLKPSASLVPDDKTLLFTNAGMVPFKRIFLGQESVVDTRVTTVQRCVRAGGKHNDLENVGVTARHHTFFEMLGNFSFGDYFKEQAITYAWDFITNVCDLDKDKLWITYYSTDLETKNIWLNHIGVPENRLIVCGAKDNFWSMGATGPCGPCTEIFYDHGPEVFGGIPGSSDEDGDRFVEIWNLVFMQYNQTEDGQSELPKPCVDTGSGLERLAAVLQGVHDNYDIDQFRCLIDIIESLQEVNLSRLSKRVIADHSRAISCLINDGVCPSNEGRGYVLRRLLRRAACFMRRDGQVQPLLANVVAEACVNPVLSVMQQKDLAKTVDLIRREEEQFIAVVEHGNNAIAEIIASGAKKISGAQAFKLYDTYGLPFDLTQDLATASNILVDEAGFKSCMNEQKTRSRQGANFASYGTFAKDISLSSEFVGYENIVCDAKIIGLYDKNWQLLSMLEDGMSGFLVLDKSVFYAESGGQIADTGEIICGLSKFIVHDVQKYQAAIVLSGVANGRLDVGASVTTRIDLERRQDIARNHTATHLLHAALRAILGIHVEQKGSLVSSDLLRFDFSHSQPLTKLQLQEIEQWVLDKIRRNLAVTTKITTFENAKQQGAMALFDGKYGEDVRLLAVGDVSLELCGGTHVHNASEIGTFIITSESGIAAGIRRVTAITGRRADAFNTSNSQILSQISDQLGGGQILEKLIALQNKTSDLQKQIATIAGLYAGKVVTSSPNDILVAIEPINDSGVLGLMADKMIKTALVVVLLSNYVAGKHALIVLSRKDDFDAGGFVKYLGQSLAVKGGGKGKYARGQVQQELRLEQLQSLVKEYMNNAS